jgi:uroporphyrinogen III methyltransferase/synthase
MGVHQIEKTVNKLVTAGMSPDTPAAIIQRGTFMSQGVWTGALRSLPELVEKHAIKPPVVFVVGEVVDLRSEASWLDAKPLLGVRAMVTRAPDQATPLYQALRDLGAEVLPYPTIATVEHEDTEGWRQFTCIAASHRWLVFTSENGVRFFVKQFIERYGDIRRLAEYKIAAIGEGTSRALKEMMLKADFVPSEATVTQLGEEFLTETLLEDTAVVRIRGDLADPILEKRLAEFDVECVPLTTYKTIHPDWPTGMKEKLFEYPPDAAIFTSSSTVKGMYHNLSEEEIKQITKQCVIASIGPSTSKTINEHGMAVTIEAGIHTIDELIRLLIDHFTNKTRS